MGLDDEGVLIKFCVLFEHLDVFILLVLLATGSACESQCLCRCKVWMTLRDEAEHQGEQLMPYSFRHSYGKGMHAASVPIANICEAMGHIIEVHLKSYARFKPSATADLVSAVKI